MSDTTPDWCLVHRADRINPNVRQCEYLGPLQVVECQFITAEHVEEVAKARGWVKVENVALMQRIADEWPDVSAISIGELRAVLDALGGEE